MKVCINIPRQEKQAIASLKAECGKEPSFTSLIESNLKKSEVELIASYVEDSIDEFITIINKAEDESFSQKRKESITQPYLLQQLCYILENLNPLGDKKYAKFKGKLIEAINQEKK